MAPSVSGSAKATVCANIGAIAVSLPSQPDGTAIHHDRREIENTLNLRRVSACPMFSFETYDLAGLWS